MHLCVAGPQVLRNANVRLFGQPLEASDRESCVTMRRTDQAVSIYTLASTYFYLGYLVHFDPSLFLSQLLLPICFDPEVSPPCVYMIHPSFFTWLGNTFCFVFLTRFAGMHVPPVSYCCKKLTCMYYIDGMHWTHIYIYICSPPPKKPMFSPCDEGDRTTETCACNFTC